MNSEPTPSIWPTALVSDTVVERVQLDDRRWVDMVRGLVTGADALHCDVPWQKGKVFPCERRIDESRSGSWQSYEPNHISALFCV